LTPAWIFTAIAVGALGVAAFFGASASSKAADVNLLIQERNLDGSPAEYQAVAHQYETAVSDGRRYDRYAKVALGTAGAAAAVAAAFFIVDTLSDREARVALAAAPAGKGAGALGSLLLRF
jgi:hypothetical protein